MARVRKRLRMILGDKSDQLQLSSALTSAPTSANDRTHIQLTATTPCSAKQITNPLQLLNSPGVLVCSLLTLASSSRPKTHNEASSKRRPSRARRLDGVGGGGRAKKKECNNSRQAETKIRRRREVSCRSRRGSESRRTAGTGCRRVWD